MQKTTLSLILWKQFHENFLAKKPVNQKLFEICINHLPNSGKTIETDAKKLLASLKQHYDLTGIALEDISRFLCQVWLHLQGKKYEKVYTPIPLKKKSFEERHAWGKAMEDFELFGDQARDITSDEYVETLLGKN